MDKRLYVKICHDEGVVFEHKFKSEKESDAFVLGYHMALEALDIECDDHFVCTDILPAMDDE